MLTRKEQLREGNSLPSEWIEKVRGLLYSVYEGHCLYNKKDFEVFGFSYPDEILIAVCLVEPNNDAAIPVSYLVSVDLLEQQKPEKILDTLVDSIGIFFDSYFANPDEEHYTAKWEETKFKGIQFFYKVSRENIALTLMADELLKKDQENN